MFYEKPIPRLPFFENAVGNAFEAGLLICADDYFGNRIIIENSYYKRGIAGAEKKCYMRREAAFRLEAALEMLPQGITFKLFDAWRSVQTQQSLYDEYYLTVKMNNPHLTDKEAEELTKKFVSKPSFDENHPAAHNTGGAIDLTLFDLTNNQELNMGTEFDDFTEKAYTCYFEKDDLPSEYRRIRNNRRLLYHCMTSAGFTNLPSEWWHYDYGNCFWSYYTKKPALFRGIISR